jgi:hypothetical protein
VLRLYGVVLRAGPTPAPAGVDLLPTRDLAAAVESVDGGALPADVERHHAVVQALFDVDTVLPAPAGTMFRDAEVLQRWVDLHYVALSDALAWLEHRAAARVHVTRTDDAGTGGLAAGPATSGESLASAAADIIRQLRPRAVSSLQLASTADRSTAAYLVERELWHAFVRAAQAAAMPHPVAQVAVTGPWPAYDFVRLQFA